jgi:hypothetical protein
MEPDEQVVCLMDVLGFENILKHYGLGLLRQRYATLMEYVKDKNGPGIDIVSVDGHAAVGMLVIGSSYFSDSVLFWAHYNQLMMRTFTSLIADAVCFGIEVGLPLRGAMAVGDLILDNESGTFLGEPLVEVARAEKEQNWIGVSFGPSFLNPPRNEGFDLTTMLSYKSHYKSVLSPVATGMVVDWPRKWRESRKTDVRPEIRSLDWNPAFTDYYATTLGFVDFSERNHDWFKTSRHLGFG